MNKTVNLLLKTLEQYAEPKYLEFFHKLSPDIKALGVRSPILQKIVKKFIKEHDLLKALDKLDTNAPYELLYAKAFAISQLEFGEVKLAKIKEFLPYLNGWALCDGFCTLLKDTKLHQKEYFDFILPLFSSNQEFTQRFALVMALIYFNEQEYLPTLFKIFDETNTRHYYVHMAVAWAIATIYCYHKEETYAYLKDCKLSKSTFNQTIRKICESKLPTCEDKELVKKLKRI